MQAQVSLIDRVAADGIASGVTERVGSRGAHWDEDVALVEVVVDVARAFGG